MAKIRLHPGVWSAGAIGAFSGIAVMGSASPVQEAAYYAGLSGLLISLGLLIWGIKVDGEHWWARSRIRMTWPYALILVSLIGLSGGGWGVWKNYKSLAKAATPPAANPAQTIAVAVVDPKHIKPPAQIAFEEKRHRLLLAKALIEGAPAQVQAQPARVRAEKFYFEDTADGDQRVKIEIKNRGPGIADMPKIHMAATTVNRLMTAEETENMWAPFAAKAASFPPPVRGMAQIEDGETLYSSDDSSVTIKKDDYQAFVTSKEAVLYVFAILTYSDDATPVGHHSVSEFCAYKRTGSSSPFSLCGAHNRIYQAKNP